MRTEMLGLKGSPTSVKTIFAPAPRKGGPVFDSAEGVDKAVTDLLDTLFQNEPTMMSELLNSNGKDEDA